MLSLRIGAVEITPQTHEQRHGIRKVEAKSGDGDDGAEALVGGKVEAVQAHLDQHAQNDRVDGYLAALVDLGEDTAEG